MALTFHVKLRILLAPAMLCLSGLAGGADAPDAREILKSVRAAQTAQQQSLTGKVRSGWKSVPFKLTMSGNTVRWEFSDPPETLQLRLGEKDSQFEEIGKGGAQKVSAASFDKKVRDTDISYEDLSMRFLYWSNATVEGDETMLMNSCWIVRVEPPSRSSSQYSKVKLWITKNNGALMQAEAYGHDGKLARRFKVVSGQSLGDGLWMLKQMRIEQMTAGADKTPSYLEVEKPKSD
ncbi:MAG: outer membrane lipoprotein-sorting protein [Chthoniobacteraceae bacterium]